MALTGRVALFAVLGAGVVGVLVPSWNGVLLVAVVLAIGVGVDLLLAGCDDGAMVPQQDHGRVRFPDVGAAGRRSCPG